MIWAVSIKMKLKKVAIIGGGAAGFFAGINAASRDKNMEVHVFEKTGHVLTKVRISGGGRCNVTHHCFDPAVLVGNYPRGYRELIGPFQRFAPKDTIRWFEERGVPIVGEADGRMFPETNTSETIIELFMSEVKRLGINLRLKEGVEKVEKQEDGKFLLKLKSGLKEFFDAVVIASGGGASKLAESLGHTIIEPVPSLFTFNIKDPLIEGLPGVAFPEVEVKIPGTKLMTRGPLLITHWGLSGPAILKLSAWGARVFHEMGYDFKITVNFIVNKSSAEIEALLMKEKGLVPNKLVFNVNPFGLPKRFWDRVLELNEIEESITMAHLSKVQIKGIVRVLTESVLHGEGKSTNKDEFVTAGGVNLKEIDFKRMESKFVKNLFFTGEVLDIDGVTGGFNFQAAWTTAFIVAESLAG